uniref:Protein FAM32A n=1 Tax=Pyrodinium bahamense TaxID=73915 RepID=A0A7S0FDA6_9DINO|mmetsp:Transcript_23012/g.63901  ORF Transcript_23012/g.63901 Transcript_23012/m.63901 type:complete len:122 (+) Transcript_23012:98-463(+)
MSSSSSTYDSAIKGSLKLKGNVAGLSEVGQKAKKRKTKHQEELEQLKELARKQEEEEHHITKSAKRGPTTAERAFQLAKDKRTKSRIDECIQYTHRQRMDRFNAHLGSLSEHFDIPKVGPG